MKKFNNEQIEYWLSLLALLTILAGNILIFGIIIHFIIKYF